MKEVSVQSPVLDKLIMQLIESGAIRLPSQTAPSDALRDEEKVREYARLDAIYIRALIAELIKPNVP